MLPLLVWLEMETIIMKGYSGFPSPLSLQELHYQIVQYHIQGTRWMWVLFLCRDAVGVFYNPADCCNIYLNFFLIWFIVLQGSLNKFPDFFRMGTFIDSTHMKL